MDSDGNILAGQSQTVTGMTLNQIETQKRDFGSGCAIVEIR